MHPLLHWESYYADMILEVQIEALLKSHSILSVAEIDNVPTNANPLQWEREHKERMLLATEAYFKQHVNLKFVYIGQLVVRREMWDRTVTCSPVRGRAPNRMASVFRFVE